VSKSKNNNRKRALHAHPLKVNEVQVVEERINGVMLAWPIEEMKVLNAWLSGAI
jgi:hypothetical protein